jgi:hypothetical protein
MHCDVCLDRLPKLPALMMLSPSSMQDRFLEFGASACLPKLPELSLTTQGFLYPQWESRNLRNTAGIFWSTPWHAATPIDSQPVSRCHVLVVPNEKEA